MFNFGCLSRLEIAYIVLSGFTNLICGICISIIFIHAGIWWTLPVILVWLNAIPFELKTYHRIHHLAEDDEDNDEVEEDSIGFM